MTRKLFEPGVDYEVWGLPLAVRIAWRVRRFRLQFGPFFVCINFPIAQESGDG